MDVVLLECASEADRADVLASLGSGTSAGVLTLPYRHESTAAALLDSARFLGLTAELRRLSDPAPADPAAADPAAARTVQAVRSGRSGSPEFGAVPLDGAGALVEGRPSVVALGADPVGLAALFGRLTGRPVVRAPERMGPADFRELAAAGSLTVAPPATWSSQDLLGFLAARRESASDVPIGYLYPFGHFEPEFFALKAVLFGRFFRGGGRYRFVYPLETRSGVLHAGDADVVLGRGESAADTARLLEAPGDFLFATPHSNGVNMGLGAAVLCARTAEPCATTAPRKSPPCFSGAPCNRKRPDTRLTPPSAVRSAVAFLYTCMGVLWSDAAYDSSISLATRFAGSPYTAALMTTPGLSLLDRAGGPFVADRLRAGEPLGVVSAEFNRRHGLRYGDTDQVTVLFGDPEFTIGSGAGPLRPDLDAHREFAAFKRATGFRAYDSGADGAAPLGSGADGAAPYDLGSDGAGRTATRTSWTTVEEYAAIDYARCVVAGSRMVRRPDLADAAGRLAGRVDELWPTLLAIDARAAQSEMAGTPAGLAAERERRIAGLQQAWLDYFTVLVGALGGYVRLQTDRYFRPSGDPPEDTPCPYCGGAAHIVPLLMAGSTAGRRTLVECVACTTVLDTMPPIRRATLRGPAEVRAGDPLGLVLEAEVEATGAAPVACTALLEPFNKSVPPVVLATAVGHGRFEAGVRTLRLRLPAMGVPPDLTPGVYFLNAIVLVGPIPAVLRRNVIVTTEGRPEHQKGPLP